MYMQSSFNEVKTSSSSKIKPLYRCKRCWKSFSFAFQLRKHLRSHLLKSPSAFVLDTKWSFRKHMTEPGILTEMPTKNNSSADTCDDLQSDKESLFTECSSVSQSRSNRLTKQIVKKACVSYIPGEMPKDFAVDDIETVRATCSIDYSCESAVDLQPSEDNTSGVAQKYNPHIKKRTISKTVSENCERKSDSLDMNNSSSFNDRTESKETALKDTKSYEQIMSDDDALTFGSQENVSYSEKGDTLSVENRCTKQIQHYDSFSSTEQNSMVQVEPSVNIICKINRKYIETAILSDISEMTQDFANKLSVKDTSDVSNGNSTESETEAEYGSFTRDMPCSADIDFQDRWLSLENWSVNDNNNCGEIDFSDELLNQNQALFCDFEDMLCSNTSCLNCNGERLLEIQDDVSVEKMSVMDNVHLTSYPNNEYHTSLSSESTAKSDLSIQAYQRNEKNIKFQQYNIDRHKCNTSEIESELGSTEMEYQIMEDVLQSKQTDDKENAFNTRCYPDREEIIAAPITVLKVKESSVDVASKTRKQKLIVYTEQDLEASDPLTIIKMPINSECCTEDILEVTEASNPYILQNSSSAKHNSVLNVKDTVKSRTTKLRKCKERITAKTDVKAKLLNSALANEKQVKDKSNGDNMASGISTRKCIFKKGKLKTEHSTNKGSFKDFKTECQKTKTQNSVAASSDSENMLHVLTVCQSPNKTKEGHTGVLMEEPVETSGQWSSTTMPVINGQIADSQLCTSIDNYISKDDGNRTVDSIPNNAMLLQSNKNTVVKKSKNSVVSCKHCHRTLQRSNIQRHMKYNCSAVTKESLRRPVKCHICLKTLWICNIKKHYASVHHINDDITQMSCDSCGEMGFESFEELDRHWKQHRLDFKDLIFCIKKGDAKLPGCGLLCIVCEKEVLTENNIRFHMVDHVRNGDFNKLKDRKAICPVCLKIPSRNASMDLHVLSHWNVKLFVCIKCNRQFVRYDNLQKHAKKHRADMQYLKWLK